MHILFTIKGVPHKSIMVSISFFHSLPSPHPLPPNLTLPNKKKFISCPLWMSPHCLCPIIFRNFVFGMKL